MLWGSSGQGRGHIWVLQLIPGESQHQLPDTWKKTLPDESTHNHQVTTSILFLEGPQKISHEYSQNSLCLFLTVIAWTFLLSFYSCLWFCLYPYSLISRSLLKRNDSKASSTFQCWWRPIVEAEREPHSQFLASLYHLAFKAAQKFQSHSFAAGPSIILT